MILKLSQDNPDKEMAFEMMLRKSKEMVKLLEKSGHRMAFEKIKKTLLSHKQELDKRFHIKEIGIFGSYVRNEQKKESDVDILVEFKKPLGLLEFLDAQEFLEQLLKLRVDLVTKKALKPYIGKHILEEVVYL